MAICTRFPAFPLLAVGALLAACQHTPTPPDWESDDPQNRLQQARVLHFRGVDGDVSAASQARQMFEELRAEDPSSARVLAYLGSARLLQARDAWAPWDKGAYGAEGVKLLDQAVEAAPEDVEVRFLRGVSTVRLPESFGRTDMARADLAWAAERADDAWRTGAIDERIRQAALDRAPREEAGNP